MSRTAFPSFDAPFDHQALEASAQSLWEAHDLYRFDPDGEGEVFSVDTPPPYVSASHLHVGHAMSYTQAEIVVRWHRMKGERPFYPMGFDDNGLPTERYVERAHGIRAADTDRAAFRALCRQETARGAERYEALWRRLGLSVDWSLSFSTIDPHCQRTAQLAFLRLRGMGRISRILDPVLWDPTLGTALSQADLETRSRKRVLHELAFRTDDGRDLPIATTRPELIPAVVALYHHPDDPRFAGIDHGISPLDGRHVPIHTDRDVDRDFGTGLMMVCTFGDADDVRRWKRDGLATRTVIGPDGRLTCDPWTGSTPKAASKAIVAQLQADGAYRGSRQVDQVVPVAERSEAPVEWILAPQWSVHLLDRIDAWKARSDALQWHPTWMKSRLDHWIAGLRWDWTISRQRAYGVPIPAWLCEDCGSPVFPTEDQLPIDPVVVPPPRADCPACGGALRADPDVLDTWMTSSTTPMIHGNWAQTEGRTSGPMPMTVRVQAFEIIRTWLFYTLTQADTHLDQLPWRDVMISGWGLDEQGHKISKRNLEGATDDSGFNRYDPAHVIDKYGADALRHWAGRGHLGQDLRYHTKSVRQGRRVVMKLWNAARLGAMSLEDFDPCDPPPPIRPPEDRDVLHRLDALIPEIDAGLAAYDYATGLEALDRFLFATFCDDWLEAIKDRLARPEDYPPGSRRAAQSTLYEGMRTLVGLYAPYLPFVTEGIWQNLYQPHEGGVSIHTTRFPSPKGHPPAPEAALVWSVQHTVRALRTEARRPQSTELDQLVIDLPPDALAPLAASLRSACRARSVVAGPGRTPVSGTERAITVTFVPRATTTTPE